MTRTLSDSGLREYLKTVVNLEKSLYEQNILWNTLNRKLGSLGRVPQFYISKEKPLTFTRITKDAFAFLIAGAIVGALLGLSVDFYMSFTEYYSYYVTYTYTIIFICAVLGVVIGFLIFIVGTKNNVADYNREVIEKEQQRSQAKDNANYELTIVAPQIRKELEEIRINYDKTRNVLQMLYDLDIIYPKYRNMVAVCAFYEYVLAGRCTQLEGHEGAINIYESEIRLNRIICQLDDVLDNLEEIKSNQRELFYTISDANERTQRLLNSTVSRLESKLSENNRLLEMNQYNSSVIAQNTNVLAYYEQLRSGRY